jgi:steroid 5-alpha reductase family enzyme
MQAVLREVMFVIFPFIVGCIFLYLVGSFISVSWNIADWTENCRIVCTIWGISFGFALLVKLEVMR